MIFIGNDWFMGGILETFNGGSLTTRKTAKLRSRARRIASISNENGLGNHPYFWLANATSKLSVVLYDNRTFSIVLSFWWTQIVDTTQFCWHCWRIFDCPQDKSIKLSRIITTKNTRSIFGARSTIDRRMRPRSKHKGWLYLLHINNKHSGSMAMNCHKFSENPGTCLRLYMRSDNSQLCILWIRKWKCASTNNNQVVWSPATYLDQAAQQRRHGGEASRHAK